jgi:6-phosphogluconolactonase
MEIRVLTDAETVAREAAKLIAKVARESIAERGQFLMAVSGGTTPWQMLRALGKEDLPWKNVYVIQVDEREAPEGHADRNLTHLRESLLEHAPLSEDHILAMPVDSGNLELGARRYSETLCQIAGSPPVLDLVHLGLGTDGHTASLVPDDPALRIDDCDVAITGIYQGRKRMTLTYPMINRSRTILWMVTGSGKILVLKRLLAADLSIPAGRICQDHAIILADRDAAGNLLGKCI